jgi:YVTN family beta-propeller protein
MRGKLAPEAPGLIALLVFAAVGTSVISSGILSTPLASTNVSTGPSNSAPAIGLLTGIRSPLVTGLVLTPSTGTVGTNLVAAGAGFPANATISFTFAGTGVASNCSSNSTGDLVGNTSTPCAFTVPSAPAGSQTVSGLAWRDTGIDVGSASNSLVYDSGMNEVFATNISGDNVTVVSATDGSVISTVAVGSFPTDAAYDSRTGQIFVSNDFSANVSVISDINNSVVDSVTVQGAPLALAYDNGTGDIYVSDSASNNVSVISASNDSVIATIAVGVAPYGIAYDPNNGEVFVANSGSNNVSVINDTNYTVVSTIQLANNSQLGNYPDAVAFDAGTREAFVTDGNDYNVSVISAVTDAVVAMVPAGPYPTAIAYDPDAEEMFIADAIDNNVTVVATLTDSVLATLPAVEFPTGVTYDSDSNAVFVGSLIGNELERISPLSNGRAVSTAQFEVEPSLKLSSVSGIPNSEVAAAGLGFAANAAITFTLAGTAVESNCSTDSAGSFPGTTTVPCTFTVPATPGRQEVVASDGTNTGIEFYFVNGSAVLSPGSGTVGSTVTAMGTDFVADSNITFSFAGIAVATTCSATATGSFPGTTGTACTFKVPPIPGGREQVEVLANGTSSGSAYFAVDGNLSISATMGSVGSTVIAGGDGFPANGSIAFTVAGVPVGSNCQADPNGTFPGTTGTPCDLAVPATPAGLDSVDALSLTTSNTIGLGTQPFDAVYDTGTGQVFITDSSSGTVSVISDLTDSVVASVAVGDDPSGIAYDSGTGQVYVANFYSDNVSVISDSNDSVVASVAVGSYPSGIAYDSNKGELFVADTGDDNVSVINDTSDTVVQTVPVGADPDGVAYDFATGQMFVTNENSANVSVIAVSNNSVVATVTVEGGPTAIAYDSGTGQVFVVNSIISSVSVISDLNDSVVTTVAAGYQPSAIAYDPGTAELLVADFAADNLSVIADSTDTLVATVAVGGGPIALGYDSSTGDIFVANSGSENVDVIYSGEASAEFKVRPSLDLETRSSSGDVGQTVTLNGDGFGSAVQISAFTLGSAPIACDSATIGSCTGGEITTAANGSFSIEFTVPMVPDSGPYNVTVNDTAGDSATVTISVYTDPTVNAPTATPVSIDLGQSTTFTSSASFGTGSYTYAWTNLPSGCAGSGASIACTPSVTGTFSVSVNVTDSDRFTVGSASLAFTVYPDPTVEAPYSNVSSGLIDAGQSVLFTTTAEFGTGVYSSYAWSGLPPGCAGSAATVSCSGAGLPSGTYTISVTVTDSNGRTSNPTPPLSFFVYPDPTVSTPTATRPSVDLGQSTTFSVTSSGSPGSGSDFYAWSGLPTGCTETSTTSPTCTVTGVGLFSVQVHVTDSNRFVVTSGTLAFTVYPDPTANVSANRTAFDAGQSVLLMATAGGGSGQTRYAWSGLPTGCTGTTATIQCTPGSAENFSVKVKVTDSNGASAQSNSIFLVVASPLSASISAIPTAPVVGELTEFSAGASGGTGALTYSWEFNDGSNGSGAAVGHRFASAGSYAVKLWVNDTTGSSIERSIDVTVSGSNSATGVATIELWIAGGVVLAIVAVIVSILLLKRVRRTKESASEGSVQAEVSEPPQSAPEVTTEGPV